MNLLSKTESEGNTKALKNDAYTLLWDTVNTFCWTNVSYNRFNSLVLESVRTPASLNTVF